MSQVDAQPADRVDTEPVGQVDAQPAKPVGQEPVRHDNAQPADEVHAEPAGQFDAQLADQVDAGPAGQSDVYPTSLSVLQMPTEEPDGNAESDFEDDNLAPTTSAEAPPEISPNVTADSATTSDPPARDSDPQAAALSEAPAFAAPDSAAEAGDAAATWAEALSMAAPDEEENGSGFEDDEAPDAGASPDLGQTTVSHAESAGSGGGTARNDIPQSAPQTPAKLPERPTSSERPTSGTRTPKESSAVATGGEDEEDYEEEYEDDFDETMTSHNASRASGFETDGGDDDDDGEGSGFEEA